MSAGSVRVCLVVHHQGRRGGGTEPNLLGRDLREQAEIERWNRRMSWNCSLPSDARFKIPVRSFKAVSAATRLLPSKQVDDPDEIPRLHVEQLRPYRNVTGRHSAEVKLA